MRDIVLTSLATTLLCEKSASEQFICGPVQYLAEVIPQTSTAGSSLLEFLQFVSFNQIAVNNNHPELLSGKGQRFRNVFTCSFELGRKRVLCIFLCPKTQCLEEFPES
jgi:hypothetical protein